MAKKPILFFISHGHGSGSDKGAVNDGFVELELARTVAKACYDRLKQIPPNQRTWKVDYSERNVSGYTLAGQAQKIRNYQGKYRTVSVDIHFNAGGGDGVEVWVPRRIGTRRTIGAKLAQWIIDEFKKCGQNSRGIKYSDDLYFLRQPGKGIAVLVECGFLDNKTDRKNFDTVKEQQAYGQAIAKALIRYAEKYA